MQHLKTVLTLARSAISHFPELQRCRKTAGHSQMSLLLSRSFENLDELEEILFNRCQQLLQQQDLVRGLTNFHWWPQVAA